MQEWVASLPSPHLLQHRLTSKASDGTAELTSDDHHPTKSSSELKRRRRSRREEASQGVGSDSESEKESENKDGEVKQKRVDGDKPIG